MNFKFLIFIVCFGLSSLAKSQVVPSFSVTKCSDQSTGYYFMSAAKTGLVSTDSISYNIILDKEGNLVYFKKFTGRSKACDFKLQCNGLVSYFSDQKFYLMDKDFIIRDSVFCKNEVITDKHDLQVLSNGHYLLLGYEEILVNLSAYKFFKPNNCAGSPNATVTCGVIQELDVNKNVVFEWRSKNYFKFMEMDTFFIADPKKLDWTHFNAVELDQDGNILVSVRNFNEITKINRRDSSIIWRLGGNKNQFTFKNDLTMFKGQHDVRRLANGNITLFDNGRALPFHRAEAKEYQLDEKNLTLTLVWNYINDSTAQSSEGLGNVQRLPNNNTLVNYGTSNKLRAMFTVVNAGKQKCFEIQFKDRHRSYRVFNFNDSLFTIKKPIVTSFKKNGRIYLDAGEGYRAYLWSNGATTRTIAVTNGTLFSVYVPTNDGGYISSLPYKIDVSE